MYIKYTFTSLIEEKGLIVSINFPTINKYKLIKCNIKKEREWTNKKQV